MRRHEALEQEAAEVADSIASLTGRLRAAIGPGLHYLPTSTGTFREVLQIDVPGNPAEGPYVALIELTPLESLTWPTPGTVEDAEFGAKE